MPNNQRQQRTSHALKDVLPLRICANYCAPCQQLLRAFPGRIRSPPHTVQPSLIPHIRPSSNSCLHLSRFNFLGRYFVRHTKRSFGPFETCACMPEWQRTPRKDPPLPILGSWFFESPDVGFWAAVVLWAPSGGNHLDNLEAACWFLLRQERKRRHQNQAWRHLTGIWLWAGAVLDPPRGHLLDKLEMIN